MTKGRPLEDAPGWRVIEHPHRHPWRAGYIIVPIALAVGTLQILVPSHRDGLGSPDDRRVSASSAPSPGTDRAPESPPSPTTEPAKQAEVATPAPPARDVERRPRRENVVESAESEVAPLPSPSPLAGSAGTADQAVTSRGPIPIRVFIHHAAGTRNALPAIQLAAYLQTHGFAVTGIREVEVAIERPSIRYFFAGDRPATRRLVEAIGAFFAKAPGRPPEAAADFSHFAPKPRRGNVEVWLPPSAAAGQSHST